MHSINKRYICPVMKNFLKRNTITIVFTLLGAIGGFLYWKFVGCQSGTCFIRSVWYMTTLWGTLMGYLIGDILNDLLLKKNKKKNDND